MPFAPGQSGNPGGKTKSQKMFRDALVVALKRASADGVEAIQAVADGLVSKAIAYRDVQAIREIADRIDGKVPQAIGGTDELDPIRFTRIERLIVKAADTDSGSVPAAPGTVAIQGS